MQVNFGSGIMGVSRTDITTGTPLTLGVLQDVSVDFSFTNKELTGQYQFAVDVARAGGKITAKAKAAQISANTLNTLFFGQTVTAMSSIQTASNEAGTVPTATTYTVTSANATNFKTDLGVVYSATGKAFSKVATAPAAGQYSLAAGIYTFAAADANAAVSLSYTYTATSDNLLTISNQLMGQGPTFQAILASSYRAKKITFVLNQCIATKMTWDQKNEDYTVPDYEFQAFADASGTIGTISITDA